LDSHIPPTGASTTTGEILAALAAEEPHGATADHVARALRLGLTGEAVEAELEELMGRGLLDRRGLGYSAVYTLSVMGRECLP
jgi:DNA-binding transcriptional ArsR family regulator